MRQAHLVHILDETFHQLGVAAGEDELDQVGADLRCQHVPVYLGDRRTVVKADEGMAGGRDQRGRLFHRVFRVQFVLVVIDQLQRVPGRGKREEQILRGDQDTASTCAFECVRRPDLR